MDHLQKEYNDLAKRIVKLQRKVKRHYPENHLLNIVEIHNRIIHWTPGFENEYQGRDSIEMFRQYVEDLKKASERKILRYFLLLS